MFGVFSELPSAAKACAENSNMAHTNEYFMNVLVKKIRPRWNTRFHHSNILRSGRYEFRGGRRKGSSSGCGESSFKTETILKACGSAGGRNASRTFGRNEKTEIILPA